MRAYSVYDVFTKTRFAGNPLAVVRQAEGLSDADMQTIAREFNFSETSFVLPPENQSHSAKIRIFTPTTELAFAGHPTIGTAIALRDSGDASDELTLELNVGPIPITIHNGQARFTTRVPLSAEDSLSPDDAAACIGLTAAAIRTDRHAPVLAGLGTNFVLTELTGPAALATAMHDLAAFRAAAGPDSNRLAMFVYVRDGQSISARMFAPLGGTFEDPATGSASAALAAWLGRLDGLSQSFEISQGVEMGRPSTILADVVVDNGQPVSVRVAGHAVRVMDGHLAI